MNDKALRILEYHKIINLLVDKASSASGKELCQKLTPMTDIKEIEESQQQTADAFTRLVKGGRIHSAATRTSASASNHLRSEAPSPPQSC